MANQEHVSHGVETDRGISTAYLYAIVLVAAVGGFVFGYDLSLISGAIIFLNKEFGLTPFWYGAVAGSAILGCPFGPLVAVWMADAVGRRKTLVLSAILFMASAIGCAVTGSMLQFIVWRFVGGMGVGLASTVSPMYIAEVAPAGLRGRLVVVNQLAIVIGLSMSVLVTYWLSFGEHWRWMFASQVAPVFCLMLGLVFVPESPRWLAAMGKFPSALAVLAKINGRTQAEKELKEIQVELGEESGGFRELLRPGVRRALILGILLMVFSQINGVNMILLYTPTLFLEAGITTAPDAILNSVYIDGWILLCTIIAFWLTRKFGRRSILICGTIGMALGHVLMFLNFTYALPTLATLAAMLVPTGAFTLTLAPLSWVVLSEIFPNRVRGKAMSLATCAMFASSYITVNVFPMVLAWFKVHVGNPGGTFLIFTGICLLCSLFVWWRFPRPRTKPWRKSANSGCGAATFRNRHGRPRVCRRVYDRTGPLRGRSAVRPVEWPSLPKTVQLPQAPPLVDQQQGAGDRVSGSEPTATVCSSALRPNVWGRHPKRPASPRPRPRAPENPRAWRSPSVHRRTAIAKPHWAHSPRRKGDGLRGPDSPAAETGRRSGFGPGCGARWPRHTRPWNDGAG